MPESVKEKTNTINQKIKKTVFLASLLALSVGGVYFYWKDKVAQDQIFHFLKPAQTTPLAQNTTIPELDREADSPHPIDMTPVVIETQDEITPSTPTDAEIVSEEIIQPAPLILQEKTKTAETNIPEQPKIEQNKTVEVSDKTTAFPTPKLRDDLILMRNCQHSFQQALPTLSPQISEQLSTLCQNTQSIGDQLQTAFETQKRFAIQIFHRENDPSWQGKIKSWLARLIQIRTLDPNEEKTEHLLDLAHLQLEQKQIEQSVQTLKKLPPLTYAQMQPYVQLAEQYTSALSALNNIQEF